MIRKWISTILMIVLYYLLQTTLFKHIKLANVVPNLLIIITVSCGYMRGSKDGLITGLLCGLLSDFVFGSVIGLHALIYMFIGYISGYTHSTFEKNELIMPLLFIGSGDIFYGIFYYIFEFLLRGRLNFIYYFIHIILPETVYTMLAAILFFKLFAWIDRLLVPDSAKEAI